MGLNDVEIDSALRSYFRFYCKKFKTQIIFHSVFYNRQQINGRLFSSTRQKTVIRLSPLIHP